MNIIKSMCERGGSIVIYYITQYGSTVYIGIAMVFVFPHTLGKFSSYFQFQVNSTSDDYTV